MGSGKQPEYVDAKCYLTIEPQWERTSWLGTDDKDRPILKGARIVSMTQNRPTGNRKAGAVVTNLTLRIDAEALLPLQPDAVIHIRAGDVETIHIYADAPDPYDDPRQQPDPEEIEP